MRQTIHKKGGNRHHTFPFVRAGVDPTSNLDVDRATHRQGFPNVLVVQLNTALVVGDVVVLAGVLVVIVIIDVLTCSRGNKRERGWVRQRIQEGGGVITCFDGVVRYTDGFQVTMLDFRSDPIIPPNFVGLCLVKQQQ